MIENTMNEVGIQSNPIQLKSTFKKTVVVTPEYAAILLKYNANNRPISKAVVDNYAGFMKRNTWVSLPQTRIITFNADGCLIDGQQRLNAIIQSGVSQEMDIWQTNTSDTAMFLPFDRGKNRTITDVTKIAPQSVGVIRIFHSLIRNRYSFMPPDLAMNFISSLSDEEKEIFDHITSAKGQHFKVTVKTALFYWCINTKNTEEIFFLADNMKNAVYDNTKLSMIREKIIAKSGGTWEERKDEIAKTCMILEKEKLLCGNHHYKYKRNILEAMKTWAKDRF